MSGDVDDGDGDGELANRARHNMQEERWGKTKANEQNPQQVVWGQNNTKETTSNLSSLKLF